MIRDTTTWDATERPRQKTPRIDAMAKEGIRFADYRRPPWQPSRRACGSSYPRRVGNGIWVTGRFPNGDSSRRIDSSRTAQGPWLQDRRIGKWHLGFQEPFLPRNQGFDHYFGLLHNLDPVETVFFEDKGGVPLMRNGKVVKRPAEVNELTKVCTDEALDFIERGRRTVLPLPASHHAARSARGERRIQGNFKWGEYGDAIQELDHSMGRILDSLKRLKIADNTLVIYASDNGRGPGRNPNRKSGEESYPLSRRHPGAGDRMGTGTWIACRIGLIRRYPHHGLVSHFCHLAGIKVPSAVSSMAVILPRF